MNTKEAFEDPRIVMLEEIILDEYEHGKQVEEESIIKNALHYRWMILRELMQYDEESIIKNALHYRWMILRELMQYDEESKRLLSDFNDRIKAAATALFNKTKGIYEGMMKLYDGIGDLEVEGKLKLGYTYPYGASRPDRASGNDVGSDDPRRLRPHVFHRGLLMEPGMEPERKHDDTQKPCRMARYGR
jgi:hypothetical protein